MSPTAPLATTFVLVRRLALLGIAMLMVLASCGREPTAPSEGSARIARGLTFTPVFPHFSLSGNAVDLVAFTSVHVLLHRADGGVALDTTVVFPADSNQVTVSLSVKLSPTAPPTGEPMNLDLGYLNAQGDVVFKGSASIIATPSAPGSAPPAPVSVPVVYAGPGATAKSVRISPRSQSINTGQTFSFGAEGLDASGTPVPNTPIVWTTLEPTLIQLPNNLSGSGTGLKRGSAHVVAQLITGQADTVDLTVNAVPSAITLVSGSGQNGIVFKSKPAVLSQPLVVNVTASDGLPVAGATVTFAAASGGGSLSPTNATTDAAGNAQATWTLGNFSGQQTATASVGGVSISPVTFTATGAPTVATKLVITSGPTANTNFAAGAAINLAVTAQDIDGDPVVNFTGPVTVVISAGSSGATLGGTVTVNAVNGVASFPNLSILKLGSGYALTATSGSLTAATTATFNVVAGAASAITILSGANQTGPAGIALAPIQVSVSDASGNPVAGAAVTFAVVAGGGSVTPSATSTDGTGRASTIWTLGSAPGTQTITVSAPNTPTLTINATAAAVGNTWVIATQPAAQQTAGAVFQVVAQLKDAQNNLVTSYNGTAAIALSANPGSATLSGTATVTASGGVATFSGLSLNKAASGYTLAVSSAGASNGTTTAFNVGAAAASTLALQSGNNQTGTLGQPLAQPVVVKASDAFGNVVTGTPVTFTIASGGGSVTPTAVNTNSSGLASAVWTLGATGAQTLTVASTGLSGSPITVAATTAAGGTVVQTILSPNPDTITAIGGTQQLTTQGLNSANQPVAGNWTYASRNAAIATVNASGLVTAVGNGSTYVVATEAGGSKDSSLTVVQQRIASINVSPANRSLYQGSQFQYTAQAVDGNNVALASQPAITWSSTATTVASVNSTGLVQALTIGSTQIRATSGNAVGVASLVVKSQITSIGVTYDTTGAPAPDVFTLTALGSGRPYRAIAHDTLGNVLNGVTFTWSSTNPSVAVVDTAQPNRAHVTAVANGVTSIQASAQGVVGSATLNVSQVLSSIDLQPTTVIVAVGGNAQVIARGKDANGFFIPGGNFTFASNLPSVATVNASTGVVTGVSNSAAAGPASITASLGTITSNVSLVSVNNSGPAVISFGRDTIGVGRGASTSVPILLSKPFATAVTVNLSVTDTLAFWSQNSVTIPAGQTAVNATLNGHNAGSAFLYAVDPSSTYAPDTAVVNVQANARMTNSSYGLNATDQLSTQVLLSDPSPAGGTYVTFSYSVNGVASVSPSPAYIPTGQLAANVVITGLGAGTVSITPSATGVNGTASSVFVSAANLNIPYTTSLLGAGQQEQGIYVQVQQYMNQNLPITLTSTDTNIVTVQPSVNIGSGQYYQYFPINARGVGAADIIATSPGWRPDTVHMVVTTPKVTVCCSTNTTSTAPQTTLTVYAADSTTNVHPRGSSLTVRISSSDTNVMKVIDTVAVIPAGSYYNNSVRIIPGGTGGVAYLKVTASGHTADSVLYTVHGPALSFSWSSLILGSGQEASNFYVQVPNVVSNPLTVTFANSNAASSSIGTSVTIPSGSYYAYFTVVGTAPGSATYIASAPGYTPDTATVTVTTPRVSFNSSSGSIPAFSTTSVSVYSEDSTFNVHNRTAPLTVTMRSADTNIVKIDTVATIQPQTYYLQNGAQITGVAPGTAWVYVTAPGQKPDSMQWTVTPAPLNFSFQSYNIGARQTRQPTDFYVYTPAPRSTAVPVTITQKNPSKVGLSATSLTIPANLDYQYFTFSGLATGVDTLVATAPGYLPATAIVRVTTPHLVVSGLPQNMTTTSPPYTTTVYAADSTNQANYTMDTVVVHAVSSNPNVLLPGQAYFPIVKGQYYANPTIQFVGVGTATITYSDSANSGYLPTTTTAVTVTGPTLQIAGGNGVLGMRQQTSGGQYYVYAPNNVATPLTVNLLSTSTSVAKVPSSVTIPAGSYYAYFNIVAQDTVGTIQIQATATGYSGGSINMQVTPPKFIINTNPTINTTTGPTALTVYAADANGNVHNTTENVTVTLASSATGVASLDSVTVQIDSGTYVSHTAHWIPGVTGTAQLTASDTRSVYYQYSPPASQNVTVQTPAAGLSFSGGMTLGLGQYDDNQYVSVPDYRTTPLTIPLGHAAIPKTATPASVTIPVNSYYSYFRIAGTALGLDTVFVAPSGHIPAKGQISVTQGRVDPISGWPGSIKAGDSVQVTIYARDANQTAHYLLNATPFTLAPNSNIQFVSGGSNSAVITSVVMPADQYSVSFWLKGVTAGNGAASISATNYSTYSTSVTVTP